MRLDEAGRGKEGGNEGEGEDWTPGFYDFYIRLYILLFPKKKNFPWSPWGKGREGFGFRPGVIGLGFFGWIGEARQDGSKEGN